MLHPLREQRHRQQEERRDRHDHQRAVAAIPARRIELEQVRQDVHGNDSQGGEHAAHEQDAPMLQEGIGVVQIDALDMPGDEHAIERDHDGHRRARHTQVAAAPEPDDQV